MSWKPRLCSLDLILFPGCEIASSLPFVGISDAFQLPQITAEPFVPHPLCFSFYDCRVDSFPRQREITVEVVLEILKVSSNEVELVEAGQIQMDDSFMSVFSSMDSERQCALSAHALASLQSCVPCASRCSNSRIGCSMLAMGHAWSRPTIPAYTSNS